MADENSNQEKLVTIADISKICGLEINTVRKWINESDIKVEYQEIRSKQIKSVYLGTFIDYVNKAYEAECDPESTNKSVRIRSRNLRLAKDNLSAYLSNPSFRPSVFPPVKPGYVSIGQAVDELHQAIGGDSFEATEVVVGVVTSLPVGENQSLPRELLDDLITQYKK